MRDVDEKDLVLHGLKKKEEILKPITQILKCRYCGEENAPIAVFCVKCGKTLAEDRDEEIKKLQEQIQKRDQATLEVIERIKTLEERLAKMREKGVKQ